MILIFSGKILLIFDGIKLSHIQVTDHLTELPVELIPRAPQEARQTMLGA